MRYLQQQRFLLQEKIKSILLFDWKLNMLNSGEQKINRYKKQLYRFHYTVKMLGLKTSMDDYEKRKLSIFNQLNFFQLTSAICIVAIGLCNHPQFPVWLLIVAGLPGIVSLIVLWLNSINKQETAILFYFIAYPIVTSVVYMSGINAGVELFFILYGILSVFFLQQISYMVFSIAFSMVSYFMLAIVLKVYRYQLETTNIFLYLFNQLSGIVFIFYGLFLIKKENAGYQARILAKNIEIEKNSVLLQQQTVALSELNTVKNKLFSVIAHDLKVPMYALRNLFNSIREQKVPAKDIKAMLPDVIINIDYTTSLMENLLQWAKHQMNANGIVLQNLDIVKTINDVQRLLQLQANAKQIDIQCIADGPVHVMADKDAIQLVLRNLLSNAIKFTPRNGAIAVVVNKKGQFITIAIEDSGVGMPAEAIDKIQRNDSFSTNGTAHEPGTGLGLMLCKEFLQKNNSQLMIESVIGKGSKFSFELPTTN